MLPPMGKSSEAKRDSKHNGDSHTPQRLQLKPQPQYKSVKRLFIILGTTKWGTMVRGDLQMVEIAMEKRQPWKVASIISHSPTVSCIWFYWLWDKLYLSMWNAGNIQRAVVVVWLRSNKMSCPELHELATSKFARMQPRRVSTYWTEMTSLATSSQLKIT